MEIKLVILDMEMPERNGIQAAECIREFEKTKSKKRVPIIGLTGHESAEAIHACIRSGMNQVLTKPITKDELPRTLAKLIE